MAGKLVTKRQLLEEWGIKPYTLDAYCTKGLNPLTPTKIIKNTNYYDLDLANAWRTSNVPKSIQMIKAAERKAKEPLPDKNGLESKESAERREKIAKANLAELKYLESIGLLIPADIALNLMQRELFTIKQRFEQLAAPLAAKVYSENNQKAVETIIQAEIIGILNELTLLHKTSYQLSQEVKRLANKTYSVDDETQED